MGKVDWQQMDRVYTEKERNNRTRTRRTFLIAEPIDFGGAEPNELAKLAAKLCGKETNVGEVDKDKHTQHELVEYVFSHSLFDDCVFKKVEEVSSFMNRRDGNSDEEFVYSSVWMTKIESWLDDGFEPKDEDEALALEKNGLFRGSLNQLLGQNNPIGEVLICIHNAAVEIQKDHFRMIINLK